MLLTLFLLGKASDRQLQERFQRGNQRAITVIVSRYSSELLVFAGRYARTNPVHEPADLVNQAFLRLIGRLEGGTIVDKLGPYLRKSIHHLHLDDLRRHRIDTLYLDDLSELAGKVTQHQQEPNQENALLEIIIREVSQMRQDQRLIFELRVFDRRDFSYIARELSQEERKVTNIYYNVVKTLKNRADKLYDAYLASA